MYKQFFIALMLVLPAFAGAHVTVKPAEVGVGAWQTFNVSVPVEKDQATVGIRLIIPEGLDYVTPNVKPGWKVSTVKEGVGEEAKVKEILWTEGSVPEGMRDDFFFSAHVPSEPGTLMWKAYQTYEDGSIVAWDLARDAQPKTADGEDDFSVSGPYSETTIINDLVEEEPDPILSRVFMIDIPDSIDRMTQLKLGFWLMLSLIMSGLSLALALRQNPFKRD